MHGLLCHLSRGSQVEGDAHSGECRNAGGRMKTAVSSLDLRRAASLDEALGILRDETRVPIAGATDVYVALNFGTLVPKQFLDIWALDELRTIVKNGDTLVIGALTSYT